MKKFRKHRNKRGAVEAFYYLEKEGFGKVLEVTTSKGSTVVRLYSYLLHNIVYGSIHFEKVLVPQEKDKNI